MGDGPFFESSDVTIYCADSREAWRWLPEASADALVTSPPFFGLRDYGVDGQLGLEDDPQAYIDGLADLLTGYGERVLKPAGSLWLNLGDTYSARADASAAATFRRDGAEVMAARVNSAKGWQPKCLLMIPERVALALIKRGWILRNRVVWAKPNGMPTSVQDRLATKHEALFHLVRQPRYFYDLDAIREPFAPASVLRGQEHRARKTGPRDATIYPGQRGQTLDARNYLNGSGANPGDVWSIPTQPYPAAHFAVFPPELVRRPILATVPEQVCASCGTPRERIIERVGGPQGDHTKHGDKYGDGSKIEGGTANIAGGSQLSRAYAEHGYPERRTVGWTDCGCDSGWRAGTVLDPFFGSGTTGVMARKLGRRCVGVELNPDYCALAADRFRQEVLDWQATDG